MRKTVLLLGVLGFVLVSAMAFAQAPQELTMFWNKKVGSNLAVDDVRDLAVLTSSTAWGSSGIIATTNRNAPTDAIKLFDARTGVQMDKMAGSNIPGYLNRGIVPSGLYNLINGDFSGEGAFFATSLSYIASTPLRVYYWSNINAAPVKIFDSGAAWVGYRMGDAFDVRGNVSDNSVSILISGNSATAKPLRFTTTTAGATWTSTTLATAQQSMDLHQTSDGNFWTTRPGQLIKKCSGTTGADLPTTDPGTGKWNRFVQPTALGCTSVAEDEANSIVYGTGYYAPAYPNNLYLNAFSRITGAQLTTKSDERLYLSGVIAGSLNGSSGVEFGPNGEIFALSERQGVGRFRLSNLTLVDGVGGTPYTTATVQGAIDGYAKGSWKTLIPLTVAINPYAGPYNESLDLNDASLSTAAGPLPGDLFIRCASTTTPAVLKLRKGRSAADDGIYIYQSNASVAFKDLLFCPSQTATVLTDELIKVDENPAPLQPSSMEWVEFLSCIFTDVNTTGTPYTTTKAGALVPRPTTRGSSMASGDNLLQVWGDTGESQSAFVDDCTFYGGASYSARLNADGVNGEAIVVDRSLSSYNGAPNQGAGFQIGGTKISYLTITGEDAGAGPLNCTAAIQSGWHAFYNTGATNYTKVTNVLGVTDQNAADRGFSGTTNNLYLGDSIFTAPNAGIVGGPGAASRTQVWERVTVNAAANILFGVGNANRVTAKDCIFTDAATAFSGTLAVELINCALGASGAETIGALGTVTTQTAVVAYGPIYANNNVSSATLSSYLDVTNYFLANKSSTAGALAGGADYLGGALPTLAVRNVADTADETLPIDYGTVNVGNTAGKQFRVKNTGPGEPLTIQSLALASGGPTYALTTDTLQSALASGASRTLGVTYTPPGVATHLGQVDVVKYNNLTTTSTVNITLTGNGLGTSVRDWRKF